MYGSLCTCNKVDNDKCTSKFKCNIGTRQGCKLSTILFILFLNDLIEDLKNSGITGIWLAEDVGDISSFMKCFKQRLTRMDQNRLPSKCYKMLRNLDESGRITWA